MNKISKNFKPYFILIIPALSLPLASCISCSDQTKPKPYVNDSFLGFEDNRVYYDNQLEPESYVDIHKVSEYVYTNTTPITIFTAPAGFTYSFRPIVKNEQTSTRAKFFLNPSSRTHGLNMYGNREGKEFISELPQISAFDPKVITEKVYINFECNDDVFLVLNFKIYDGSITTPGFYYNKTSYDDKKSIVLSSENIYKGFLECPKNKQKTNFVEDFVVVCKQSYYQKLNLNFDIAYDTRKGPWNIDPLFAPSFSMSLIPEKKSSDKEEYYLLHLCYTFLADITPSKDEAPKESYYLCCINVTNAFDGSLKCRCEFEVIWK